MYLAQAPLAATGDVPEEKCPNITNFHNRLDPTSRSFKVKEGYGVGRMHEHLFGESLDSLSLGKPRILPNGNTAPDKFLAGTDNPTGADTKLKKNFLMCGSLNMRSKRPIISLVETVEVRPDQYTLL